MRKIFFTFALLILTSLAYGQSPSSLRGKVLMLDTANGESIERWQKIDTFNLVPGFPLGGGSSVTVPLVLRQDTILYNPVWNNALKLISQHPNDGTLNGGTTPGLNLTSNYFNTNDTGQSPSEWQMNGDNRHNSSLSFFYIDHRIDGQYVSDIFYQIDSVTLASSFSFNTNNSDFVLKTLGGGNSDFNLIAPANCSLHLTVPPNGGSSGQVLTTDGTGVTSWTTISVAHSGMTPADSSGAITATAMMMGYALAITPTQTGIVEISVDGSESGGSSNATTSIQINYGTGTAPTYGAAATGAIAGSAGSYTEGTSLQSIHKGFARHYIVTGLTLNTVYWIDLQVSSSASAGHLYSVELIAKELH